MKVQTSKKNSGVGGGGGGDRRVGGGGGRLGTKIEIFVKILKKLELMFMKHYAPNRCLCIKVANLRTGVGECRDVTPTNCSLKIYLKRELGGGGGVGLEGSGWM